MGMGSAVETLCGQAYGAQKYEMLGIYFQRSTIILSITGIFITLISIFTKPILKLLGQSNEIASAAALFVHGLIPQIYTFQFIYIVRSPRCKHTWSGFSFQAFSGLMEFFKLSAASAVMICLESWYYQIILLVAGLLHDPKLALDSLSIW
ncbi:Protein DETOXIFICATION 36 [Camellia lanceoleosa]|uniref:Protein DETOXIFICATION 36 n=1 Tax=Camellia lanceoleosa TaxID=1840588 RepID=A0ACC0H4D6_9ERIC|nr:Protein DETOXIFICATION 36 [Camellia lanceoleosa]